MQKGHIVSSEKDRYELVVETEAGTAETVFAKGRGVFREKGKRPMIGDYVTWTKRDDADEAVIEQILPRRNRLLRPPVANVDQVLVVETIEEPRINALQLDKLLVVLEKRNFPLLLCFNKIDRVPLSALEEWIQRYEKAGYPVFSVNALTGEGVPLLEERLAHRMTAIAGPSGAGKSTLIRYLTGEESIQTGLLSEKTARGKQTTRTSRLFRLNPTTFIFDTPGFSSLDLRDFDMPDDLADAFPEIRTRAGNCRFRDCTHRKEPGCAVKEAVESGEMDRERYASYLAFYDDVAQRKRY